LKDSDKFVEYNLTNLSEFFLVLLNATRKDLYIIKYDYSDKSYDTIEINNCNLFDHTNNNIPDGLLPFSNIDECFTYYSE
jgi:hypothetical protein